MRSHFIVPMQCEKLFVILCSVCMQCASASERLHVFVIILMVPMQSERLLFLLKCDYPSIPRPTL